MFKICLFDLDDTLLKTNDLKAVREAGKRNDTVTYIEELRRAVGDIKKRVIYDVTLLNTIRAQSPGIRLGIFTRSPSSYAKKMLDWAYHGFNWDIVVAYEDVERTKPYGDGIDLAMDRFDIRQLDEIVLVGDSDSDVRAAYHAGCVVVIDKSEWPQKLEFGHWDAIGHMPDAIISKPTELLSFLQNPHGYAPELERLIAEADRKIPSPRFDKINHFVPRSVGGTNKAFPIFSCGRSFANYKSLKYRKQWHLLSQAIIDQKEADVFPESWIEAFFNFIANEFLYLSFAGNLTVTTIPHRPGRKPRLENFLGQLEKSPRMAGFRPGAISFAPGLLAYKEGVRSNSNDKLTKDERFVNVKTHLMLPNPSLARGKHILVLDDVTTSGASLICAKILLEEAGASGVTCLSLAQNISDVI